MGLFDRFKPPSEADDLIDAYLKEMVAGGTLPPYSAPKLAETELGRRLSATPELSRPIAVAALERVKSASNVNSHHLWLLKPLLSTLLRKKASFDGATIEAMVEATAGAKYYVVFIPIEALVGCVEDHVERNGLDDRLRSRLTALHMALARESGSAAERRVAERIGRLLAGQLPSELAPGGPWSQRVLDAVAKSTDGDSFRALLDHAASCTGATPTRSWQDRAAKLLAQIGEAKAHGEIMTWLAAGPTPGTSGTVVPERDADFQKGAVWLLAGADSVDVARAVGDFGDACLHKIAGVGPVSARVGNACINVLARLPGTEPVAQLGRIKVRAKYANVQRLIDKAFVEAARRAGLEVVDLQDLAVPTYGLGAGGVMRRTAGDYTAELRVTGTSTEVAFSRVGRALKSAPAELRREHPELVGELKRAQKLIEQMLPAQRRRIEEMLVSGRSLAWPDWRARFLEHPLVSGLVRRLVWHVDDGVRKQLFAALGDGLVDVHDRPLPEPTPSARVSLWHPLGFAVDDIMAWRRWLSRHEVTQPFKQAHREVYLLTDAELRTETYSNRFAAHVLRQHQLAALCRERGWRYDLQGGFDSSNSPTLNLPRFGLRAELWVEGAAGGDESMTGAGIYLYVSTDQVRFHRDTGVVPLTEVPALAFSEVMRDVDLFVGVCSIGADPSWHDAGQRPDFTDYWHSFSFGELGESARTRREVIEGLLPMLAIRDRCSLDGRYLEVRGDRHTYRIHVGSGNILIEPGSRYLCIVPARGKSEPRVSLPFEGDGILNIILSKAFLLANDRRITDPTILRQLE